jgi:hypothetical protein
MPADVIVGEFEFVEASQQCRLVRSTQKETSNMKSNARDYQTSVVYDEAEARRRLGQVYNLLLHAARQKRAREAQVAAAQGTQADAERTDDQIASLQDFAAQISEGLDEAEVDFATRLRIVNELEVEATLAIEEGEKVIHAHCILKEETLSTVTPTSTDTAPYTPAPPRRWPGPARATPPAGC